MSGENPARFQVGRGLDSRVRGNDEGLRKVLPLREKSGRRLHWDAGTGYSSMPYTVVCG